MKHSWKFPKILTCISPYFPNFTVLRSWKTKLMMILPRIKAAYDNYIHFNHINRKYKRVTCMYTVFYKYLQRYEGTIFTALC